MKKSDGDQDSIIDLTNGQTLPIKFHIKEGAANVSPIVEITNPANNAKFTSKDSVTFTVKATDLEDGDLSAQVTWSADRADLGVDLGTEATASITTQLPVGTHVITASVTDSNGANGTGSITVEIVPPLLEPWQSVDIGGTGISSYYSETETFELSTNATNTTEGPSTQYAYQYQESNYDFLAEGCIESLTNNPTAAAGILLLPDASAITAPYLYASFSQNGTKEVSKNNFSIA